MHYETIEKAIAYYRQNATSRPDVAEVARHAGLSTDAFKKLFRDWAGISPHRFLQMLTTDHARQLLRKSRTTLQTAMDTGLSGQGRLYDHVVRLHAFTPGELRSGGRGVEVTWGCWHSPFGPCIAFFTERGLCGLELTGDIETVLNHFRADWTGAALQRDDARIAALLASCFAGKCPDLQVKGTAFQVHVWRALLSVPPGTVISYQALAGFLGKPRSARAVAGAVAANPIAWFIPCHRVIRSSGAVSGYRWGPDKKQLILAWEAAADQK